MGGMQAEEARQTVEQQLEQFGVALTAGQSGRLKTFSGHDGRFHGYSLENTLSIWAKSAESAQVASFNTCLKLGCSVRKNKKKIAVLTPVASIVKDDTEDEPRHTSPNRQSSLP